MIDSWALNSIIIRILISNVYMLRMGWKIWVLLLQLMILNYLNLIVVFLKFLSMCSAHRLTEVYIPFPYEYKCSHVFHHQSTKVNAIGEEDNRCGLSKATFYEGCSSNTVFHQYNVIIVVGCSCVKAHSGNHDVALCEPKHTSIWKSLRMSDTTYYFSYNSGSETKKLSHISL